MKKFDVVDGQQRLTTIILLLYELISRLCDHEGYNEQIKVELQKKFIFRDSLSGTMRSYIFNYMACDQNYSFMSNYIFGDKREIDHKNYNAYAKKLNEAKTFFSTRVEAMSQQERGECLKRLHSVSFST